MIAKHLRVIFATFLLSVLVALSGCGGGNSGIRSSNSGSSAQNGTVNFIVSDDSTQDWATIGVKILGISLVPQGGGSAVSVYTAPNPAPVINLVQLDQLGEMLANVQVAQGTYTSAILTIAANPGDVTLVTAADPETGFAGPAGTQIPSSQIQIQGAQGTSGSLTVPVTVRFQSPLVVTANQSNQLDLEFSLAHPAFIVDHVPANGGSTIWAVNFNGPLRHHPLFDITRLILRHMYGTVTAVATDNTSITITRDFPKEPPTTPETAITTQQSFTILADASNGTILYDVDGKTSSVIKDFSSVASTLTGKFVRIAARYQQNGTLVAVRIWESSTFNSVWLSPEGHVLHVDKTNNIIAVQNEDGRPVSVTVNGSTQFFYRVPQNALSDAQPIATGTTFIQNQNIVRGFKVHVGVVDPLASPLVAQTVDIEIAKYSGVLSNASLTSFTTTHNFVTATDDYSVNLGYISNSTQNGKDANGNQILGFKWWNFTFPTLIFTGSSSFMSAVNAAANFGGTVGTQQVVGDTYVTWNDPANQNAWSAQFTIVAPTPLPLGTVSSAFASSASGGSFGMTVPGGTNTVTVDVSNVSGSATLVYQIDKTNSIVTVSAVDLTTSAGMSALTTHLTTGTPVKVFGVPETNGNIKAYVLVYYTGLMPSSAT